MNNHFNGGILGPTFCRPLFTPFFCLLLAASGLTAQRGTEYSLSEFRGWGLSFETFVTAKPKTVYDQQPELFWSRRPIGFELKGHYTTFFHPRWGVEFGGHLGGFPLECNVSIPKEFIGGYINDYDVLGIMRMPYWGISATFLHLKRFNDNGYLAVGLGFSLEKYSISGAEYGGGYWDSLMVDRTLFELGYDIPKSRTVQPSGLALFRYYHHIGKLCYVFASVEGCFSPFKFADGKFTAWGGNNEIVTGTIYKHITNVGFEIGIHWALVKRKEMFPKKKKPKGIGFED